MAIASATIAATQVVPTETATLAPEVESSPTPEPTSGVPLPAAHIRSHRRVLDNDWLIVVGEVLNTTADPLTQVAVTLTAYDAAGQSVGTEVVFVELTTLAPNTTAPFRVMTEWKDVMRYEVTAAGIPGALPRADLRVVQDSSYFQDEVWFVVSGQVQNTGAVSARAVRVVVTLYDAHNEVVGLASTVVSPSPLPAGGISAVFQAATDQWFNYDHYTVQVEGQ